MPLNICFTKFNWTRFHRLNTNTNTNTKRQQEKPYKITKKNLCNFIFILPGKEAKKNKKKKNDKRNQLTNAITKGDVFTLWTNMCTCTCTCSEIWNQKSCLHLLRMLLQDTNEWMNEWRFSYECYWFFFLIFYFFVCFLTNNCQQKIKKLTCFKLWLFHNLQRSYSLTNNKMS